MEAKGFVETPQDIVDLMVHKLFKFGPPSSQSTVLDPGCGKGAFIGGIIRWCQTHNSPMPMITGIELDSQRLREARAKFVDYPTVAREHEDS